MFKIKKIFALAVIAFLLTVTSVFALGMTAGIVRIVVDVGSANFSSFGLMNSGNDTITVNLRAEGDAAQFLEFQKTVELLPKILTYVYVKATIPSTYDGSLGGNITGNIFAVQEGTPGQVQINVQAKKSVQILIPEFGGKLPEVKSQIQTETQAQDNAEENPLTGFATLVSTNSLLYVVIIVVVLFFAFIVFRRYDISIKPKGVKI